MQLRSLVLSHDEKVTRVLTLLLNDLGVTVERCGSLKEAKGKLSDCKFDAVFADMEHSQAVDLLRSVRKSKHNKRSIIFAITEPDQGLALAFNAGAHFVIHKPLSVQGSKRTLKAAHGMLMREKRSHFRADIAVSGAMMTQDQQNQPFSSVLILDLHRSGALIESKTALKAGQKCRLWFTVPETTAEIQVEATVRWTDIGGRAGLRFEKSLSGSEHLLHEWSRRVSTDFEDEDLIEAGTIQQFERVRSIDLR